MNFSAVKLVQFLWQLQAWYRTVRFVVESVKFIAEPDISLKKLRSFNPLSELITIKTVWTSLRRTAYHKKLRVSSSIRSALFVTSSSMQTVIS
jgi:hypothetical protein